MPFIHGVFVWVLYSEALWSGIAKPTDLDLMRPCTMCLLVGPSDGMEAGFRTLLVENINAINVCQVDASFQLKTRLPLHTRRYFFFADNEFSLLFIWVDILATKKNLFEKVHVVLHKSQHTQFKTRYLRMETVHTSLSGSLASFFATIYVP